MAIDTSRLTGALRGLSDRFESKDSVYEAIYVSDNGDGWHYVDVLNPDGTQGVRRLVRGRVRSWPGVLVRLSYHRKAYGPDELVIIGPSELAYGSSPAPSLLEPHGDDHGYNRIDECMTLYTWQIWPLRIQPTSPESLFAHVMPGVYYADGSYHQTTVAVDVDLTAYLPVVSAWKYVTLSIDAAGAITVTEGTEHGAISVEDIPMPPEGEYPLGAVLLHINDTALTRDRFTADLRYIFTPNIEGNATNILMVQVFS